jgi:hypothetical protein
LQSAAPDLALIEAAAREAGSLARDLLTKPLEIHSKGEAMDNLDRYQRRRPRLRGRRL